MATHRIGILTGGGDAPGLNAVIRAVVKYAVGKLHWQVIGIEDSFNGMLDAPRRLHDLTPRSCQGLLHRGGTILGTTNKGDPFAMADGAGGYTDRSAELAAAIRDEGLEGLIVIGGDGTQAIGLRLMDTHGIPVVGVPKTIDNDLSATDLSFGFISAVETATDALDRLHTTAESHDRVMLLEVMGRDAGWIALWAGVAGGADCIAIPEIPYEPDRFAAKIKERRMRGRHFTIMVVAEGAVPKGGNTLPSEVQHGIGTLHTAGAAHTLARLLTERIDVDVRTTVLGHLQRGGGPVAFDRVLATEFGVRAVELINAGQWGDMVRLSEGKVTSVPIRDAVKEYRTVDESHPLLAVARSVGIEFGE
jgi:phosphofructokinase-like protein